MNTFTEAEHYLTAHGLYVKQHRTLDPELKIIRVGRHTDSKHLSGKPMGGDILLITRVISDPFWILEVISVGIIHVSQSLSDVVQVVLDFYRLSDQISPEWGAVNVFFRINQLEFVINLKSDHEFHLFKVNFPLSDEQDHIEEIAETIKVPQYVVRKEADLWHLASHNQVEPSLSGEFSDLDAVVDVLKERLTTKP